MLILNIPVSLYVCIFLLSNPASRTFLIDFKSKLWNIWWFEMPASSLTVQCWVVGDWCHVVVFQPHLTILPSPGHTPQSTSKHQQSIILQSNIISSRHSQYSWPLVFFIWPFSFFTIYFYCWMLEELKLYRQLNQNEKCKVFDIFFLVIFSLIM